MSELSTIAGHYGDDDEDDNESGVYDIDHDRYFVPKISKVRYSDKLDCGGAIDM